MADFPSRRQFLKTATVGATALSMSATGYSRIVGANERIAIGVVGCGWVLEAPGTQTSHYYKFAIG